MKWRVTRRMCGFALACWGAVLGLGCAGSAQKDGNPAVAKPIEPTLAERAADILSQAIRFRTVNPPGDEKPLARYLAGILRAERIEARVIRTPRGDSRVGRAALWARVPGGAGRPIVLLSHLDVVPADPSEGWDADPFAGEIRGGMVLGRGALDAKGLAVVHLLTLSEIARRRVELGRDVILLATPDEETGGRMGAGWIASERPDLLRDAQYLLTEGGGIHVDPRGGPSAWQVAVSEKSPCWLRVAAQGRGGHSSIPERDDAVPRLLDALDRIRRRQPTLHVVPEVARMFRALAPLAPREDAAGFANLADALAFDAAFRRRFLAEPGYSALVRDTLAITVLRGGPRTNVVPAEAAAHLDARLLPGGHCEELAEEVSDLAAASGAQLQILLAFASVSSPVETGLYRAIERVAAAQDPHAVVVPRVLAGFTDAHWFRDRGITAYGFVPRWQRRGEPRGIHGPNERISAENLQRGVETLIAILVELDREGFAETVASPGR
jgi:acetylornithine deacetylase/succinyl-diaminopimelate desuccinylase-like protein